jgi:UDP-GlcNAc:undecaprenyl-phosphate GlcNAc-1-phosphate transferase
LFFWLGRAVRAFPTAANFEEKPIPVAGIAVALGVLAGLQWDQCVNVGLPWYAWTGTSAVARIAIVAFGVLGYVDDRWGDRSVSGFGGHIRAALRGRITTGFIKMVGGGLTAFVCGHLLWDFGWEAGGSLWLVKSAVIALSANAINLLDTRPARAAYAFLGFAAASLLYDHTPGPTILAGIGAVIAWLPLDRRRKAMLGDAGSNVLGALWGVTFVAYARWEAVTAAMVLLVAFHIYAERRSLNADIAAVPLLRRMDEALRG